MEYNMRKGPASFANRSFSIHHHRAKVVQHPLEQFVALPLSLSRAEPAQNRSLVCNRCSQKDHDCHHSKRPQHLNEHQVSPFPCPAVSRLYVRGLGPSLALRRPGRWQGVECAATDGGGRI